MVLYKKISPITNSQNSAIKTMSNIAVKHGINGIQRKKSQQVSKPEKHYMMK